jgi:hypothetical protein
MTVRNRRKIHTIYCDNVIHSNKLLKEIIDILNTTTDENPIIIRLQDDCFTLEYYVPLKISLLFKLQHPDPLQTPPPVSNLNSEENMELFKEYLLEEFMVLGGDREKYRGKAEGKGGDSSEVMVSLKENILEKNIHDSWVDDLKYLNPISYFNITFCTPKNKFIHEYNEETKKNYKVYFMF